MTQMIRPGSGETPWARFGQADRLEHSKGEKKLRVDLTKLFSIEKEHTAEKRNLDTTHHLSVVLSHSETYEHIEHAGDKPFKAGWRQVAVKIREERLENPDNVKKRELNERVKDLTLRLKKIEQSQTLGDKEKIESELGTIEEEITGLEALEISEEEEKQSDVFKKEYIILNINSLAKRLGVDQEIIKEHEERGDVDVYIQERLQELATLQEDFSKLLQNIQNCLEKGENYEMTPDDRITYQMIILNHIDDKYIKENMNFFDECLREDKEKKFVTEFLSTLSSKIWWDSKDFKASNEKIALTQDNIVSCPGIKIYNGEAGKRLNHLGKPMNRIQFLDWDHTNRYAVAVGDYVYSKRPTEYASNEVPLRLNSNEKEEKWVLVNVHSLTRLGLSEKAIRKSSSEILYHLIEEKIDTLNYVHFHFVKDFHINKAIFFTAIGKDAFCEFLEDYSLQHPDEEIRTALKEILNRQTFLSHPALEELNKKMRDLGISMEFTQPSEKIKYDDFAPKIPSSVGSRLFPRHPFIEPAFIELGVGKPFTQVSVFLGSAKKVPSHFPHPGHAGKKRPRMSFIAWDLKEGRYSICCRERKYLYRPAYHSKNEVPMPLLDEMGQRQGWVLLNVHSLQRLGISSKEIEAAVNEDRLHDVVREKLERIENFNRTFQEDEKNRDHAKFSTVVDVFNEMDRFIGMAENHPNKEVKKVLEEVKAFCQSSENELQPSFVFNMMRAKLEEVNGIKAL